MVLYKHGVGFIERGMQLKGSDPLKLSFKRDTMDDILKSLIILDKGGGRVTGVSYETAEDIGKLLAEKAIIVPDQEALVGLMRQLKGYKISVETPGDEYQGVVVGTEEQRKMTAQGDVVESVNYVVLKDKEGKIKSVELRNIVDFEILDAEAKEDLDFYLEAVTSQRKKNVKALTIFLDGDQHDVRVSYIMAMPSWRVSYRLAYDKDETLLQGWGIIDNKLDEDLKDITLSLVAGKPISFIYDIYTPRIVPRPIVREEVRTVSAPVELEGGLENLRDMEMMAEEACLDDEMDMMRREAPGRSMAKAKKAMAPMAMASMAPPEAGPMGAADMAASTSVQTKTVEMGEFFKYDIATPVTVKRGQSAMVPILQEKVTCCKEHVYNASKMPKNPVVTMRLKNDSGAILERGPILVLDEGTYVGEAILPYTTIGTENHIAYSVDLGVNIKEEVKTGSVLKTISISNRYFQKEYLEWRETEYTVENKKKDNIDLVIEHPKSDYKVDEAETKKPTEETENYFRWKFEVKDKSSSKFKVREIITRYYSEYIRDLSLETVKSYLNSNFITKRSFEDVKEILDLQMEIHTLQRKIQDLENEKNSIYNEQSRLRQNLESLGDSQREEKLRVKYVDKLDAQEKRLEEMAELVKKYKEKINKIDKEIDQKLGALRDK